MSAYNPPTESVPIFDSSLFSANTDVLTIAKADTLYLKFPIAQGNEYLQAVSVAGAATFTGAATFNGDLTLNQSKIHLGTNAGVGQAANAIAIGSNAGLTGQGDSSIAIGSEAGKLGQGLGCIAIGTSANSGSIQGDNSIAIGVISTETGTECIAIGKNASTSTFATSVAIGKNAASTANNQITLGTTTETVRLNTITPLYTIIPTYTSSQIGYSTTVSLGSAGSITNTEAIIVSTAALPVGVYMVNVKVSNSAASAGVFATLRVRLTNITGTIASFGDYVPPSITLSNTYQFSFVYTSTGTLFTLTGQTTGAGLTITTTTNTSISATRIA